MTEWAVRYVDARDGKTYARVMVQGVGETYEDFANRAVRWVHGLDFPIRSGSVGITTVRAAVLLGYLR